MMFVKLKKNLFSAILTLVAVLSISCDTTPENSLNKIYGEDIHYFLGLQALKEKDSEKAKKSFVRCFRKGTYYPARRSLKQLIRLGDPEERLKYCGDFLKVYNDDQAKIFICSEYIQYEEFDMALEVTENIDLATAPDELIKFRLELLARKGDLRLEKEIYDWFTQKRISSEHYRFYRENVEGELEEVIASTEDSSNERKSDFSLGMDLIQQFRIAVYRKMYSAAFAMIDQICDLTINSKRLPLTYQIVADMGRACLNGSRDNIKNAQFFIDLANNENFRNSKRIKYYALIYSGMLYDKNFRYRRDAIEQFEEAIQYATDDEEYDQALWYYLQTCLKLSVEETVGGLKKYCNNWHDASYFDDFFDLFSELLFSKSRWNTFAEIYSLIKDRASPRVVARFAYLTGRLMQENFLKSDESEIKKAFEQAVSCRTGSNVYYKLLAAKELGFSKEQIEARLLDPEEKFEIQELETKNKKGKSAPKEPDNLPEQMALSARRLLLGYADLGFWEYIYDEWQAFYEQDKTLIDIATTAKLVLFLRELDDGENGWFTRSLRMIAKMRNFENEKISREVYLALFPQNFIHEVNAACTEFKIDDYVMYGLIRTESFFETKAQSSVGAGGLTQLMPGTAEDCARRLKLKDYNLADPATNIRLGTFYFSRLIPLADDSQLLALFAYNGGLKNVYNWVESSKILPLAKERNPNDLFLETVPYQETRNYGRLVLSAASMYGWLYNGKNPCDIVSEML